MVSAVAAVYVWTAIAANGRLWRGADYTHFVYLAQSFLEGRLDVPRLPFHDLTPWGDRWYVAFPPLPAVLLMPLVALFGLPAAVKYSAAFSILVGVAGVAAVRWMLGRLDLAPSLARALTLLFGLGTVYWYSSVSADVWYLAHVVSLPFMAGYVGESLGRRRPLVAGLLLVLASWARTTTVLGAVFYAVLMIDDVRSGRVKRGDALRRLTSFGVVLALGVVLMFAYNYARFDDGLNFGYETMAVSGPVADDIGRYGQFDRRFVPRNLFYALLGNVAPMEPAGDDMRPWDRYAIDPWGASIFLTTPAFLYLFRARPREAVGVAAWISTVLIAIPLLMYYNTGWVQWGYRFSMDLLPFLIVLLAFGMRRRLTWAGAGLIALSIVSNYIGTRWFYHI